MIANGAVLDGLLKEARKIEHFPPVNAFSQYLCSLSVEDLLKVRWFAEHRHRADLALIDEAIDAEEARREQILMEEVAR